MTDLPPVAFPHEKPRANAPAEGATTNPSYEDFAPPAGAAATGDGASMPPQPPFAGGGFRNENRRSVDNRRVVAYVIDLILLFAGAIALGAVGGYGRGLLIVGLALMLTYFFVCEAWCGQTLGKRAMKLRVMHIDGGPASVAAVGGRTVLRLVDDQLGGLVGLGTVVLSGRRRQRIGDLASATVVRRDDRHYAPPQRSPLLFLYPLLLIGAAVLVSSQIGWSASGEPPVSGNADPSAYAPLTPDNSHLTPDRYMRMVDDVCKQRVIATRYLGDRPSLAEVALSAEFEYVGIAGLPRPPARSRAAYREVLRYERSWVRRIHRLRGRISASSHVDAELRAEADGLGRFVVRANARFRALGLPSCGQ